MRCTKCNGRISPTDVWCLHCGRQTRLVKVELSALRSLSKTWKHISQGISAYVPATTVSILFGVIPIAVWLWLFSGYLNYNDQSTLRYVSGMVLKVQAIVWFLPFILTPFSVLTQDSARSYQLTFSQAIKSLARYHIYVGTTFISALFLIITTIICFGLPNFGSDPILKLVWIVLINYWLAVSLPVPVIMGRLKVNPWRAYIISYKYCHDVRWNLYLLGLVLVFANLIGAALLVIGLTITLPLSWFATRDYINLLFEYGLIPDQGTDSGQTGDQV